MGWHSAEVFVRARFCNIPTARPLLCKMILTDGFMQNTIGKKNNRKKCAGALSLLHPIRPEGRILVFDRTRQVVF